METITSIVNNRPLQISTHTLKGLNVLLPALLLVALALPLLLIRLEVYPKPWFDEGFTLHTASVVVDHHVYGTYTLRGVRPFDPIVSSGPTIVLPTALMFHLFGASIVKARLIPVAFTLLSLLCLYGLGARLYGWRNGLLGALLLLALPVTSDARLLYLGRQALGEPAALALISLGFFLLLESALRQWRLGALLAGFAFGLGLIAKLQTGFALLPALLILAVIDMRRGKQHFVQALLPLLTAVAVIMIWLLVQRLGTPEYLRGMYNQIGAEGLTVHFFTGLFGSALTKQTWLIVGLIVLAALGGAWRLWRAGLKNERDWIDLGLVAMAAVFVTWFTLASVGWARYTFVVLALSTPLLGKLAGDLLAWALAGSRLPERVLYAGALLALVAMTLFFNLRPVLDYRDSGLHEVVDWMRANIPPDAVIESWEWQLDGLTGRHDVHHPSWRIVYEAIRQASHRGQDFDLPYDPFQADPDYIIIGPYGAWTGIYDQAVVWANFEDAVRIGEYHILKRIRN